MTAAKYHARPGNKNARKPVGQTKNSSLFVRTKSRFKGSWAAAAKRSGLTLTAWVESTLNAKAK